MVLKIFNQLKTSFIGIPKAVWLLSLVSLINRTGTMVVAFLTLYLTESLHFDIKSAGYVMTCYGIGCILGSYIGGLLTDRIGFFKVQWISLALTGVMLLLAMVVREFWTMCFIMFMLSTISEAFRPANSVAIRMHSDDATRTRSFSLMRVSVNLAITVALSVGGLLVALGWEWLFWVDGLTCFAAAIILLVYFKDNAIPPQLNSNKNDSEIPENSAYLDKKYLFFIFLTFLGATVFMQIVWTVPAYFKTIYGWSESQIGLISALNGFVVMLVEMPLIFRIEGKKAQMWFVRLGILFYASAYLMFVLPSIQGWVAACLYMTLISFGEIFVMPFSTSWASMRAGESRQGQYLALYTMAYSASNIIAPFIGTQTIAAFGFNALWVLLLILSFISFIGFGFLGKKS